MDKPTNPKDAVGSGKIPLELVPDTLVAEAAMAFLEGALKYGRFNWRVAGVRSSIYRAALQRHLARWWNGEDCDKDTRVKHLASVIACAGILLDAELCGKLNDDRPPAVDMDAVLGVGDHIEHLKAMFAGFDPKQWSIGDAGLIEHQAREEDARLVAEANAAAAAQGLQLNVEGFLHGRA